LTGQALTAVVDLFFSFIFFAVMLTYSVWLTIVVVVSLPVYAAMSLTLNPILRQRLNDKFARLPTISLFWSKPFLPPKRLNR
jgi:subfamily B ATP-binding cassette protein HlyB/CyaB